jgi:hypothetical protein
MSLQFPTFAERPDLVDRYGGEADEVWPPHMEFIHHDPVCERYWPRLREDFPAFQFLVYDEVEDTFLAVGHTVPLAWSGVDDELPTGVPDALHRAFAEHEDGTAATAVCALLAGIQPSARSRGLSAQMLVQMQAIARAHGLGWLIAPVRPTLKSRYPLTPIERYAAWRRPDDGLLLDPWLRTHERLGARYAGIGPRGNVFRGAVADWEQWLGLVLPESGRYIVPGALEPVDVDRERDEGVLIEPNVWMVHTVEP